MHVSGGDDANQRALGTKRERDVQPASRGGDPKSMESALGLAVLGVIGDHKLLVLEYLLRFDLVDAVLVGVFPRISRIQLKSDDSREVDHFSFCFVYAHSIQIARDKRRPSSEIPDAGSG